LIGFIIGGMSSSDKTLLLPSLRNRFTHQKKMTPKKPDVSSGESFWYGSRSIDSFVCPSRTRRTTLAAKMAESGPKGLQRFLATTSRPA
jgi:hypothetical protein